MDREDMNFPVNEPIDNAVRTLDHFPNGGIIDLGDNTSGLRKRRQTFDRRDQLLPDKLSVVGRIFFNEPLNGLDIFNRPSGPDK